jgi:hypothetical protein
MNDAELLDLVEHHRKLWSEWDRLVQAEKNPAIQIMSVQCDLLARRIVPWPVTTKAGLEAKRQIVELVDFADPDGIIGSILELDAERIERAASETEGDGA